MLKQNIKSLITTSFATLIIFSATNPLFAEDATTQSDIGKTIYRFMQQEPTENKQNHFSISIEEDKVSDKEMANSEDGNSDQVQEKHNWSKAYQTYGDELILVKFPLPPIVSQTGEIVTSLATYKNVGYILTSYNPTKKIENPKDFFQFALQELSSYPSTMGNFDVWHKHGKHFMELKTLNLETGVTSRIKFIITSKNLYVLETRYVHGADEKHEHFFDSFEVLK